MLYCKETNEVVTNEYCQKLCERWIPHRRRYLCRLQNAFEKKEDTVRKLTMADFLEAD